MDLKVIGGYIVFAVVVICATISNIKGQPGLSADQLVYILGLIVTAVGALQGVQIGVRAALRGK